MQPEQCVIYPPNKPMEEITMQPNTPSSDSFLFSLDFNKKGEVIVGMSDVCTTGWYGVLTYYESFEKINKFQYKSYFVTQGTIGDALFYSDTQLLLTDDCKAVNFLRLPENNEETMTSLDTFQTEDIVASVAVWKGHSKSVIASGNSVSTLELQTSLSLLNTFKDYHTELVLSVDADQKQSNIFTSASMDRRVCLWDDRASDVASVLYQNEFSSMNSVAFHPVLPHLVVAGSTAGDVYLLDKREPKQFVVVLNCFKSGIHRMKFDCSGRLAICGDRKTLQVLNCTVDGLKSLYVSDQHSDIVRGLAWFGDNLYSCGYDRKCLKHSP